MELIPALRRLVYRYVIVDSEHVEPLTPMRWDELRYRPHLAQFGGEQITVVVRDRELSNAQESGMDVDWFVAEVRAAPSTATSSHSSSPRPMATTAAGFATPAPAPTSGAASTTS
jgi:hypothetical protein